MPSINKGMTYIGVDPGKAGGIVAICPDAIKLFPMPSSERDIWDVFQSIINGRRLESIVGVIERVHSRPRQSSVATFTFGKSYGFLRGCLTIAGFSYEEILPAIWMKALRIPTGADSKSQQKEKLRAKAQQMYPHLPIWKESRSKGKQLAIADALLIATYCKRLHEGKL